MANQHRPPLDTNNVPDAEGRDRNLRRDRSPMAGAADEARGVDRDIADADKKARTGSTKEAVRDTPPFGDFVEPPFVESDEAPREDKLRRDDKPRRDDNGH